MSTSGHHFRVGALDCFIVSDGTFNYPHPDKVLFADAPRHQLERALAEWNIDLAKWDAFISPYPSLLIDTGQQKILIDAGAGSLAPSTGQLVENLRAIGIAPADIDIVLLTHAHPDHIGGVLDAEGRPTFGQARHLISHTEWKFWMNTPDLAGLRMPDEFKGMMRSCAAEKLSALGHSMERIATDTEISAGIQSFDAAGHTPGQVGLRVSSEDQVLLAVADAVVHPAHVSHPEWSTAIDCWPEIAVQTRRRLLNQAATENALVFAFHFPAPGLGRVEAQGGSWQWKAQ